MFRNPYADGLIILIVILLFFGPKRLPMLGKSLGEGMREFKDSITGKHSDESERPEITPASAPAPQTGQPAPTPEATPAGAATRPSEGDSNS